MRSTYYPGVCTKPGTYYQGWFMYMRYTQGQNEEYLLSRSRYCPRYLLTKFHCTCSRYVHHTVHVHNICGCLYMCTYSNTYAVESPDEGHSVVLCKEDVLELQYRETIFFDLKLCPV